ncbi:MAG TPA: hypothetical protein VFR15_05775 [Chloroflexia bacterium]|nr:hypothetical protein [Chloroflexia bacterium]
MKTPSSDDTAHRHYRRTDLFLVRIWTEDTGSRDRADGGGGEGNTDVDAAPAWKGRVQRVVDGETHQFSGSTGLVEVLAAMLRKKRRQRDSRFAGQDRD